jgi:6-phosphogluconolactonase
MTIEVLADAAAVAQRAAQVVVDAARSALADEGSFSLALSGGSTPLSAYRLLSQPPLFDHADWERTHLWWSDERCVPLDDPHSNGGQALAALGPAADAAQVHLVETEQGPDEAATRYEAMLQRVMGGRALDLVLLGLGPDGHTASLFPGTAAVEVTGRSVVAVEAPRHLSPQVPRVSFTFETINRARLVVVLVTGEGKAPVLRRLRGATGARELPVARIRDDDVLWLVDRAAAGTAGGDPSGR